MKATNESMPSVRIDKWLWAARLFKTRSLAQVAVRAGHVEINGHSCKPARTVGIGDRLRVVRAETVIELEVLGLVEKRGPASAAAGLYRESPGSIERRLRQAEERKLLHQDGSDRRPDKRQRRQIRSFRNG